MREVLRTTQLQLLDASQVAKVSNKSLLILKSGTLLNLLFDTKFEILDSQNKGRQQTTKGVWMAKNGDGSILIFDIEGTDSKERGEQRMVYLDNLTYIKIDL